MVLALKLHRRLLQDGRPRELKPASAETWFIQTDACYDVDVKGVTSGIGAVLFSPAGKPVRYLTFHRLSDEMVTTLNPFGKQTANFECEFFALFCAFLLWGDQVTDAVVIYTDNNICSRFPHFLRL
jgi:ribonuclease HI